MGTDNCGVLFKNLKRVMIIDNNTENRVNIIGVKGAY
ncbi:hypothetical protein PPL_01349 [Heterostelium album PN500]|uniref:Uncharacterized protein n=1 Tax=Heterostelium pallidum (strain ATCC 26659 / Pp 5 / PN500) TaxID=670386 RepID=D3AZ09_HETP5|nr:hypothetical protein PPL_01349 [Heterostelium album PN500]EFA85566.1 hypothetical protein PPL_01349 [Heterostelium album PN500]|eukprot:XP_020437673.1 hypothetical protein PPL_01349 [Heterostelium album PN500]